MFRLITGKIIQRKSSLVGGRAMMSSSTSTAAVPSVKDLLIDLTLVDPSGARRKSKGIIGKRKSHER
jgi:hypothetical protein